MSNSTERPPIMEFNVIVPNYADRLIIEQYGPVSHLIFCHCQKDAMCDGRRVSIIGARVIVPTAMLPELAHLLACPESQEPAQGELPDNVVKLH
jgi:hypothetical protein